MASFGSSYLKLWICLFKYNKLANTCLECSSLVFDMDYIGCYIACAYRDILQNKGSEKYVHVDKALTFSLQAPPKFKISRGVFVCVCVGGAKSFTCFPSST